MAHPITHRHHEARQVLRDSAADMAEQAGALLADRSLTHDQRAALLALMEAAHPVIDPLAAAMETEVEA